MVMIVSQILSLQKMRKSFINRKIKEADCLFQVACFSYFYSSIVVSSVAVASSEVTFSDMTSSVASSS